MARRNTDGTARREGGHETVDPPTIGDDGIPTQCLSLTVSADWGHFRRIDRTVTKQTYRLPPRTTVAGLLAAIAGVNRDGYYDTFARSPSAVAIEPVDGYRTMTVPTLGLGTNPDETMESAGGTGRKSVKVQYPDSTDNRQIHTYEVLVDPSYRIDVAVEDAEFYGVLKSHLQKGTSYYPPSMGLSEYLASIEYHGEFEPSRTEADLVSIRSAIPNGVEDIVPTTETSHRVERMPAFMEAHDGGRRTTAFADYAFAEKPIDVRPGNWSPATVDSRNVAFH
jgi:CRISPR-associated protein Cas5h